MKLFSQLVLLLAVILIGHVNGFAQLTPESFSGDLEKEYLRAGEKFFQRGEWAAAEGHFRTATQRQSNSPVWRVCLAVALDKQGKAEEVKAEVQKLIELRDVESLLVVPEKMKDTGKLVFIDTRAFGDEKTGINRYVAAVKSLEVEFKSRQDEMTSIKGRIKAISDELLYMKNEKEIKVKQEERRKLEKELENKRKDASAAFDKRYDKVVGPVASQIGVALDAYAKKRGYAFIFDNSKFKDVSYFSDKSINVTQDFITDYNKLYPVSLPNAKQ